MKNLLLSLLLLAASLSAQSQNNINADTAKANRLYEEAIGLKDCDTQKIEFLKTANSIYQKYKLNRKVILIQSELAYTLFECEKDSLAIELAYKTIALTEEVLGTNDHKYLLKPYIILMKHFMNKDAGKAIDYGKKVIDYINKPSEEYFELKCLLLDQYVFSGNLEEYKQYLQMMKQYIDMDKKYEKNLVTYYSYKAFYHSLSYEESESILYYKEALRLNDKYEILTFHVKSQIYSDLATQYGYLNKLDEAKYWAELFEESISPDTLSFEDAFMYHMILAGACANFDIKKAIKKAKKGLTYILPYAEEQRDNIRVSYINISTFYSLINEYEKAKENLEKAFEFGYSPRYADRYNDIVLQTKDYNAGLENTKRALEAFIPSFVSDNIFENPSLNAPISNKFEVFQLIIDKASFLYLLSNSKKEDKKTFLLESIKTAEFGIKLLEKDAFFKENASENYDKLESYYNPLIQVLISSTIELYKENPTTILYESIFKYLEKQKSPILSNSFKIELLSESEKEERDNLIALYKGTELKVKLLDKTSDSLTYYESQLFNINEDINAFNERLKEKNPEQFNFFENDEVTVKNLQSLLADKTIFLSTNVSSYYEASKLYISVITKNKKNVYTVDIDYPEFKVLLTDITQLCKDPLLIQDSKKNRFIELSNKLYELIISPIENDLEGIDKIIFSPSDILLGIPLEILLPSSELKPFKELNFLIKNYDISYQYSATIYTELQGKPTFKDYSFLAFAPVFNKNTTGSTRNIDLFVDDLYQGIDNKKFAFLPNTKQEVETIASILRTKGKGTILLQKDATKENYNQAIKKKPYQFVHIATHGLVNFQDPELSALACYTETENIEKQLLFANEIQMQDIQADLVVLSSCESGIGQLIQGEGLIALNRSYIYAGANNVLFSLWKVSDKYSAELMIDFYKSYMINNDYSMALRAAKLKMLSNEKTANPRYWAAFILIGE